MKLLIRPAKFIVSVMTGNESAGFRVNSEASQLLASQIEIPLENFTRFALLKPYLKTAIVSEIDTLMIAIKFQLTKGNEIIYSHVMAKRLLPELIFEPKKVADIRTYRVLGRGLGRWNMSAMVSVFPFQTFNGVNPDSYDPAFLSALRYRAFTGWDFEVTEPVAGLDLLPTGRRTEPIEDDGTTISIDDL